MVDLTASRLFEKELEIFRQECSVLRQFLYAYLTIHLTARKTRAVYDLLNRNALFWNTMLGALQTSTFILLGRIFDQNSQHNIDRVLWIAQRHREIFSRTALAARRQESAPVPLKDLETYVHDAYVPKAQDFRILRERVARWRRAYEARYRDLRRKVFAHREITEASEVAALMAKTNVRELEQMTTFLGQLHAALQSLFQNGMKPVLRRSRSSSAQIYRRPPPRYRMDSVQERIAIEAREFLRSASRYDVKSASKPSTSRRRRQRKGRS